MLTTVLCTRKVEPETAYGTNFHNGVRLHNTAGCVTSISYQALNIGLTWNSQYQLTAVSTNGVECERNGYDALGRRVWNASTSSAGAWQTNFFVYDGNQIVADIDATGGLRRAYTYGPGIDNLLAMTVYTGTTVKTYFYLTDHQGTVHALADESGTIVESYRFDAWGRDLGVYGGDNNPLVQSAVGNRFLWAGKEYSFGTGFYYNRFRIYDPITGRFLSKDPSGISGGLNEFIYCYGNPVNFSDPDGLAVVQISGTEANGQQLNLWLRNPSTKQFKDAISKFQKGGIKNLDIDAHGTSKNINFGGEAKPTKDYLNLNKDGNVVYDDDSCFTDYIKGYLAPDATIGLWGCSTASGDDNISKLC